jgi:hypothetical protein
LYSVQNLNILKLLALYLPMTETGSVGVLVSALETTLDTWEFSWSEVVVFSLSSVSDAGSFFRSLSGEGGLDTE